MLEYLIKKPPVKTKREMASLMKVKSCIAFLRMLLVCIGSCLKSVLKYNFECSHPVVFYFLNNYKIPVKTQHIIPIVLYSDMF